MLVIGTTAYWNIAFAAIIGGIITAFIVFMLARKNKRVESFRLIIVGIGVSATLGSLNFYLITRADVEDAMMVGFWVRRLDQPGDLELPGPVLILAAVVVALVALLAPVPNRWSSGMTPPPPRASRSNAPDCC